MAKHTYETKAVADYLRQRLPHWRYEDGQLCRSYRVHAWKSALLLTNAIGHLAELAWHHPDICLSWGKVEVRLMSHDAGGVTDRDFELALQIEQFAQWQPPAGSALEGTPEDARWRYVERAE